MSEAEAAFAVLRQSADPAASDAVERLVGDAPDHELNRINALDFAAKAAASTRSRQSPPFYMPLGWVCLSCLGMSCVPDAVGCWTPAPL